MKLSPETLSNKPVLNGLKSQKEWRFILNLQAVNVGGKKKSTSLYVVQTKPRIKPSSLHCISRKWIQNILPSTKKPHQKRPATLYIPIIFISFFVLFVIKVYLKCYCLVKEMMMIIDYD